MTTIYIPDDVFQQYMLKHRGRPGEAKSEIKRIIEENAPEFTESDWAEAGFTPGEAEDA